MSLTDAEQPDASAPRSKAELVAEERRLLLTNAVGRTSAARHPSTRPAYELLMRASDRLFAEARRACHRDGATPTEREICGRVAARIGLVASEVAAFYRAPRAQAAIPAEPAKATLPRFDQAVARGRVLALSRQILGERERKVFLARCLPDPGQARDLDSLATELKVPVERVQQLEESARRKMARALAHDRQLDPPPAPPRRGTKLRRVAREESEVPA